MVATGGSFDLATRCDELAYTRLRDFGGSRRPTPAPRRLTQVGAGPWGGRAVSGSSIAKITHTGITFVKNKARPMLDQIEGCRGLSMLVDRETGQCIATSSWENETAMRASDEQLRPIRDRGQDILDGFHAGGRVGNRRHAPHPSRRVLPGELAAG